MWRSMTGETRLCFNEAFDHVRVHERARSATRQQTYPDQPQTAPTHGETSAAERLRGGLGSTESLVTRQVSLEEEPAGTRCCRPHRTQQTQREETRTQPEVGLFSFQPKMQRFLFPLPPPSPPLTGAIINITYVNREALELACRLMLPWQHGQTGS